MKVEDKKVQVEDGPGRALRVEVAMIVIAWA